MLTELSEALRIARHYGLSAAKDVSSLASIGAVLICASLMLGAWSVGDRQAVKVEQPKLAMVQQ